MLFRGKSAVSQCFLIGSLLLFAAGHFTGFTDGCESAGQIWGYAWALLSHPARFPGFMDSLGLIWFFTSAVVIGASPFLAEVWVKSRLAWITACITSALLTLTLCYFFTLGSVQVGIAFSCLFASVPLNFLGLILARMGAPSPGTIMDAMDRPPVIEPEEGV